MIIENTVCKNYEVEIWRNFKDICYWNPLNIIKSKPIGQIGSKEQQQQWQFLQRWQSGVMMAPAAFADQIGDAAKKLGDASYDFAKEVDWNNGVFLQAPGIRALGGSARRGLEVGLGGVMFADVCLGWFLVIFLSNKNRVWHDSDMTYQSSTHQITCWAVDRIMYVYRDVRSNFLWSTALLVRFVHDRSLLWYDV